MANYNMNSHWQTPVSNKQYKDNFNAIFKKSEKKSDKTTEHRRSSRKKDSTSETSNPNSKG